MIKVPWTFKGPIESGCCVFGNTFKEHVTTLIWDSKQALWYLVPGQIVLGFGKFLILPLPRIQPKIWSDCDVARILLEIRPNSGWIVTCHLRSQFWPAYFLCSYLAFGQNIFIFFTFLAELHREKRKKTFNLFLPLLLISCNLIVRFANCSD